MTTKEKLDKIFEEAKEITQCPNKIVFAAYHIFGLVTYDDEKAYEFMKVIIEVLQVIIEKDYNYIGEEENYTKYLLVCQFLHDKFDCLEWGTSIRSAWLDVYCKKKDIIEWSLYDYSSKKETYVKIPYSPQNIIELVEWLEDEK